MNNLEAIAKLSDIKASERAKEVFVRVRILGYTQTAIARELGVSVSTVVGVVQNVERKIALTSIPSDSERKDKDWRPDRLKLQCDLADALTREKFLQDKIDRLMRREFWRSELRVPRVQDIRKS